MRESFLATIAFAVLALFMVFAANLVAFAFTGHSAHTAGIVLSIIATAVSYVGQVQFTESASWLAHHQVTTAPEYAGPANPDAFQKYQRHQRRGTALHLGAALMVVMAVGLFWLAV